MIALRIGEHLPGMGNRHIALISREHAGDLAHTSLAVNASERSLGQLSPTLQDEVVASAHNGDLSQVGDDDDLMRGGEPREHLRQGKRRRSAHTSIDLVEDECLDTIRLAQDHLTGKHHTTDLAPRGDLAKRPGRKPRSGTVHKLNRAGTLLCPLAAGSPDNTDLNLCRAHLEEAHLLIDGSGKARGSLSARAVEPVCSRLKSTLGSRKRLCGGTHVLRTVARGINELCGPLTPLEDLLHAWSVAMQESLQLAHALLHPCERPLVEVYAVLIAPELACRILDVDERTLERVSSSLQTPVEDGGQYNDFGVSCMLSLGYRDMDPVQKRRQPAEDVIVKL